MSQTDTILEILETSTLSSDQIATRLNAKLRTIRVRIAELKAQSPSPIERIFQDFSYSEKPRGRKRHRVTYYRVRG